MKQKNERIFIMNSALKILKEQREMICDDTLKHDPMIYNGLHEFESDSLRNIFFQAYIVDWLDSHWGNIKLKLNNNSEYSLDEKKKMTLFFSNYFSGLIDEYKISSYISTLIIPYILEEESKILEELIIFENEWQISLDKLSVCRKKNRERFKKIIDSYNKEENNND